MQGGQLAVVNSTDLFKLLVRHPKMHGLLGEVVDFLVQRESCVRPWTINGQDVGTFEPASILASLPGIGDIDDPTQLNGKTIRRLGRGQQDTKGNDVSGFFVLSDAGAALLFKTDKDGRQWANNPNQVNHEIAPSLTEVESGHSSVSLLNFTKI